MKKNFSMLLYIAIITYLVLFPCLLHSEENDLSLLQQEFDLGGKHSQEVQYYTMRSECINYALDGKRISSDVYRLRIKCVPVVDTDDFEYVCRQFTLQQGDAPEAVIPALTNWIYQFQLGLDAKEQVFGIDHSKFENLVDINGNAIPQEKAYHVYNAFIDFHGFCNVFADNIPGGNGIQQLKKIGQKIVHEAAFSEAPVHLGSNVSDGSFFRNGEITLELKGLSLVNDRYCSLLEFDSGESSFNMIMKPTPNMELHTVGSSHYKGDIYKDLATNWVQKVTMIEIVVCETTLPMPPNKINMVVERHIVIHNVSEKEKI